MHQLTERLPGVVYEYRTQSDEKGVFTFVSSNVQDILGLKPSELLEDPNNFEKIIFKDDIKSFRESADEPHSHKEFWSWEGRITVKNETRWIEIRSTLGAPNTRYGLILDITERKHREQEREMRYQSLVEHLPLGVGVHIGGKLVFANKHAHDLMAAGPGDLVGKSVLDFVHPDFRDQVIDRMTRVVKGESLPLVEEKFIRMDGKVIDVEAGAIPFTFNGQPANQVIVRDITESKNAERANKRNETLFTHLFQSLPIGVVMLDESGKVEMVNKGFFEMFGYDLESLHGHNLNDFIVPEELKNEGIDLNNLIASNKVIMVETIRKHREGQLIDVILYGVPVTFENRTIGIYGVYVNISDRKKVEEELKVRNAELDNFVYKVSHDLRAPLSSILGLVNLARLPGNNDDPMDYINIIGEKVEDLDHFIGDVLSHSKNLKMEVSTTEVDFHQVISRTFTDLNYLDGAADVMVYRKIEGVEFHNDPWRIQEIFRNLVSNAIKYSRRDHIKPEIKIEIAVDSQKAEIIFADNGIGIDEVNLNRIFEMFYRATEQSNGSGIGLYIVKNAVDRLDGVIQVESKLGFGTQFRITLPNRVGASGTEPTFRFAVEKS